MKLVCNSQEEIYQNHVFLLISFFNARVKISTLAMMMIKVQIIKNFSPNNDTLIRMILLLLFVVVLYVTVKEKKGCKKIFFVDISKLTFYTRRHCEKFFDGWEGKKRKIVVQSQKSVHEREE